MTHSNSRRYKAFFLIVLITFQSLFPPAAMALTGGPSQPEVQSFEPAGTSEMVDLSSGTFTYNIPLLDVGGYPINLSYNAGATMDQEATCVGLGWNINPGVISRNMRGLPDDFDGDEVTKEFNLKPNRTYGGNIGLDIEFFGLNKVKPTLQAGLFYNNYKGVGLEFGLGISPSVKSSALSKSGLTAALGLNLNFNLNSQNGASAGASIQPSLNFVETVHDKEGNAVQDNYKRYGASGGLSFNSKQGLTAATLGANMGFQGVDCSGKTVSKHSDSRDATFSFARPSFAPSPNMPITNFGVTLRAALPASFFGLDPGTRLSAYYSEQKLTTHKVNAKAYGTLYLQNQQPGVGLLDFNREKDGPFTQNTPNLAIPVPTQDIYSVAGQGIGGSYLLKRGDIGIFSDKETKLTSRSGNLSLEAGVGNLLKFGLDVVGVGVTAREKAWTTDNALVNLLPFRGEIPDSLYEPAYFKQAGEQSVESDQTYFNNVGGFDVIDAKIEKSTSDKFKIEVKNQFRQGAQLIPKDVTKKLRRDIREKRNQNISYLNASDATEVGFQKFIENYTINNFTDAPVNIARVDNSIRKPKHISEICALREDGVRYVYGVPAYNIKQEDYHFSVSQTGDCSKGLVTYATTERSLSNNSNVFGKDNFYSKEVTPSYAHSFLLTAVVSPDYSDIDGIDGPSSGDLGSYTKINYSRVHSNYKWRLPYPDNTANRANFSPNLLSNNLDNRGSVVYGEKEIWQLHSVESKTFVAQFHYSTNARTDGLGVSSIDGGTVNSAQRMVRLDKIVLYSKMELQANPTNPVPIKTVIFQYDQSLCPGIPNTSAPNIGNPNTGKLTLKRVYFTYGNSDKGRFSPYVFEYDGASIAGQDNFKYNYQGYNRWGSYQRSLKTTATCDPAASSLGNDDFPYVKQDSLEQSKYAVAWNLTRITLPSGGTINVTYEAHDYAYVQDKNAMEMLSIEGLGTTPNFANNTLLYSFTSLQNYTQNDHVYFKLRKPLAPAITTVQQAKDVIGRDYLKDIITKGNLYFKCLVDLKSTPGSGCSPMGCPHYEYVFGYADIVDWGRCTDNPDYGFIKLKQVCLKDQERSNCITVNPIAKAGWQYTRLYYPDLIHKTNLTQNPSPINPEVPNTVTGFIKVVEVFGDLLKGVKTTLNGLNLFCFSNNYSQKIVASKSWIRLYSPEGKKLAGGSRVKRINITDNWNTMSTVNDRGTYGQEFTYRTELDLGKNLGDNITKRVISSGVASYEPMIGGDENPYRQPEFYDETLRLAPDNHYYQETPFGESFFPSPQIIYSKVTVTALRYDNSGNITNPQCVSTGQTISEYYTAKDYPTRVSKTPMQVIPAKSSPIMAFLKLDYKEYLNASQGFCVELNDMHGKPKAQWNLDDKGQRISGVEYIYKTKKKDTNPSPTISNWEPIIDSLDNRALVIKRDGSVGYQQIGVDFQVTADTRESSHETRTRGLALNTNSFIVGVFPFMAVVPLPIWENEKTRFRSISISKVINRYALLEKVVAYDATSRIETENMAYDAETGEVLLTRTYNEFGDPIYKLKYPAHFAYKGMRQAYENIGAELKNVYLVNPLPVSNTGTRLQLTSTTVQFFEPGDEIKISDVSNSTIKKAWVLNVDSGNNTIDIIDNLGRKMPYLLNQPLNIKIIRSGRRNQQSAEIGMMTLHANPISGNSIVIPRTKVIDASVTEYSDYWQFKSIPGCTSVTTEGGGSSIKGGGVADVPVDVTNPFNFGRRGVWRSKKSWVHLAERTPESPATNYQTNIRTGGTYVNFTPFWSPGSSVWNKTETNWTWSSEATKYNNYGFQLETKDPLNRYSAELPGYGNTQAIAVAANARYREIHFDGFEENNLDFLRICTQDNIKHFPTLSGMQISQTHSHTGNYSMMVSHNGNATNSFGTIQTFVPSSDILGTAPTLESTNISVEQIPKFSLMNDSTYWVSAWVRTDENYAENKATYKLANNANPRIEVTVQNGQGSTVSLPPTIHPSGNVIDGWQRLSGLITISGISSGGTGSVIFAFKNGSGFNAYFDDFRVQPYRAAMKTYVYDTRSTRLLATLDDENFATIYEYSLEGTLERVKRETERGIMTIQETRTGIKKQ